MQAYGRSVLQSYNIMSYTVMQYWTFPYSCLYAAHEGFNNTSNMGLEESVSLLGSRSFYADLDSWGRRSLQRSPRMIQEPMQQTMQSGTRRRCMKMGIPGG